MRHRRDHDRKLFQFAREMRSEPTDAERKLWLILRKHRLASFRFRRQYPIRGYIVDFVCLAKRLVVEADGGQHRDAATIKYDEVRTAQLRRIGFRILRFSDRDILKETDVVAKQIYRRLTEPESTDDMQPPTLTLSRTTGGGIGSDYH